MFSKTLDVPAKKPKRKRQLSKSREAISVSSTEYQCTQQINTHIIEWNRQKKFKETDYQHWKIK